MTEITREYLKEILFNINEVKGGRIDTAFLWGLTHEGIEYWIEADCSLEENGFLPEEAQKIVDEMIRVSEDGQQQDGKAA